MAKHIYLVKHNDDLVSHCRCGSALITAPPQLDCPWCGCGWLFTCMDCRKAFTFARAIETDDPWEDLAVRDLRRARVAAPSADDVREWVDFMKLYLRGARLGDVYVAFDGHIASVDQKRLRFDGWHARHDLPFVPQVAAMEDPSVMRDVLSNRQYWVSHALKED